MSKIAEYKALEAQIAAQLAQLDALKASSGLKRELEFEEKLRSLLSDYNFSLREIIAILDPVAGQKPAALRQTVGRKPREIKRYNNPHTGESIETRGGNHKVLKSWKAEYGAATVEGWLQ